MTKLIGIDDTSHEAVELELLKVELTKLKAIVELDKFELDEAQNAYGEAESDYLECQKYLKDSIKAVCEIEARIAALTGTPSNAGFQAPKEGQDSGVAPKEA